MQHRSSGSSGSDRPAPPNSIVYPFCMRCSVDLYGPSFRPTLACTACPCCWTPMCSYCKFEHIDEHCTPTRFPPPNAPARCLRVALRADIGGVPIPEDLPGEFAGEFIYRLPKETPGCAEVLDLWYLQTPAWMLELQDQKILRDLERTPYGYDPWVHFWTGHARSARREGVLCAQPSRKGQWFYEPKLGGEAGPRDVVCPQCAGRYEP